MESAVKAVTSYADVPLDDGSALSRCYVLIKANCHIMPASHNAELRNQTSNIFSMNIKDPPELVQPPSTNANSEG